jgi:hypothetical protein
MNDAFTNIQRFSYLSNGNDTHRPGFTNHFGFWNSHGPFFE